MTYFARLSAVLAAIDPSPLLPFVAACEGTLWLCGNGGSASIAQHWACDLSKAAGRRVQALGSNPAVLTAWANDSDYANALGAELSRLARPGDRLIALSCSGRSPNIYWVLKEATVRKLPIALVTGGPEVDGMLTVCVPSDDYGIIEDCFAAIGHWLTQELR